MLLRGGIPGARGTPSCYVDKLPAMQVHGPRDVPALRARLIHQWHTQLPFYSSRAVLDDGSDIFIPDGGGGKWDINALTEASLYYVSGDMCEVLKAAEQQIPESTELLAEIVPQAYGLVVFEHRLDGIDATLGDSHPSVDAIVWGPLEIVDINGNKVVDALGICSYRKVDPNNFEDLDFKAITSHMNRLQPGLFDQDGDEETVEEVVRRKSAETPRDITWIPLGRSDWVFATPIAYQHLRLDSPMQFESMKEDRRRLASLWLLMNDAKIANVETSHGDRGERRRAERAKQPPPDVRVVNVAKRTSTHSSTTGEAKYHLTVRSLVSGHWRNQYHPKCERCGERRRACGAHQRWINAFWRGPDDGPISGTEKVRVWR